uniref:Uncharacterized protein n=1 Tax=viral metagenome TaxID=1070528 RepID=A0A6C0BEV1_9ZZZZ
MAVELLVQRVNKEDDFKAFLVQRVEAEKEKLKEEYNDAFTFYENVVVYNSKGNVPEEVLSIIPYVKHNKGFDIKYDKLVRIEEQLKKYITSFKDKSRQDIKDADTDKSAKFLALVYFVMIMTYVYTYIQLLLARENVKNIELYDAKINELNTQLASIEQIQSQNLANQEETISKLKEVNKLLQDKSNEFEKAYYTLSRVIEGNNHSVEYL